MLPAHAPSEFSDRATLWNSVEKIEKSSDAQLAREIEVALPVELSRAEQLALVRSFVKDNFVDAGMCADFALHDKDDGNPHAHIMLTIRPLRPDGKWGAKFFNRDIAELIDRTPSTVAQSLRELEAVGLVEKKLISRSDPYHIYVKLPAGENVP